MLSVTMETQWFPYQSSIPFCVWHFYSFVEHFSIIISYILWLLDIFQFQTFSSFRVYFQVIQWLSDSVSCCRIYITQPHLLFLFLDNFNYHLLKMSEINEIAPASPHTCNTPSTEHTLVAGRLLRRPDHFERFDQKHLARRDGPWRLELVLEISNRSQKRGYVAAFSASVLRKIIEDWKAGDFEEIGVDKGTVKEKWDLECRIGLWELDTGMDWSWRHSEKRLENTLGKDWVGNLRALLPKWSSEMFLRELAIFVEKNIWEEAKVSFPAHMKAGIGRPRSRKPACLTTRDLVKEGEAPM